MFSICYFWALVCVLPQWFLCFVRFSDQGIHSDYCHLRDHHMWPWSVRSRHGLRALTTWQNKKSRRQWRDIRFSRSSMKITQLAIVIEWIPWTKNLTKQKNNHLGRTNTSRNNKSHIDRNVTFSFKVTHDGHANGDSWNEFRDLKTSRNNIKRTNTNRDEKNHVDHITWPSVPRSRVKVTQLAIVGMTFLT